MTVPTSYQLTYDFTAFQIANPTIPLPADKLEIEFNNIQKTTDEIIVNLGLIQRSDGKLQNGSVSPETLSSSTKALLGSPIVPRGTWVQGTAYKILDLASIGETVYIAVVNHTSSGSFTVDYSNGKWMLWANPVVTTEVVNIRAFGAAGDGIKDDRDAIQSAIDFVFASGGGSVYVPPGTYKLGSGLVFKSNVSMNGSGPNVSKFLTNSGWTATSFGGSGTIESEITISGNYQRGDSLVTTSITHGLSVDDYVKVVGQRDCLSDDALADWRLGYGTPGSPACYYGEFLQVRTVPSSTTFNAYSGFVFPDYRDNNNLDPASARTSTTIQKMTPLQNVKISNIGVTTQGNQNGVFRFRYGRNIIIENCSVDHGNYIGAAVFFHDCYDCKGVECSSVYGPDIDLINNKPNYNPFKTAGSQNCFFDTCKARNCSQAVDFTYFGDQTPSLFCTARNCTVIAARTSGMTSHGGTYANQFLNNIISQVRQGISCRSRNSIVIGNTITSTDVRSPSDETEYGIGLYEGWARDCIVSGNTTVGFNSGITVLDGGSNVGECFGYCGATITGNTIVGARYGFYVNPSVYNTKEELRQIMFANNVIKDCVARFAFLGGIAPGVSIINNTMDGLTTPSEGIRLAANSHPHAIIRGNRISNVGSAANAIRVDAVSGFTFTYTTNFTCTIDQNLFFGNRLADISASSTLLNLLSTNPQIPSRVGALFLTDGIAAPLQLNTLAQLFVDSADGDLKIIFGDGTVKTIVTD